MFLISDFFIPLVETGKGVSSGILSGNLVRFFEGELESFDTAAISSDTLLTS